MSASGARSKQLENEIAELREEAADAEMSTDRRILALEERLTLKDATQDAMLAKAVPDTEQQLRRQHQDFQPEENKLLEDEIARLRRSLA